MLSLQELGQARAGGRGNWRRCGMGRGMPIRMKVHKDVPDTQALGQPQGQGSQAAKQAAKRLKMCVVRTLRAAPLLDRHFLFQFPTGQIDFQIGQIYSQMDNIPAVAEAPNHKHSLSITAGLKRKSRPSANRIQQYVKRYLTCKSLTI